MRALVLRVNPLVLLAFGFLSLLASFAVRSVPIALVACGLYALAALVFLPTWRYPLACLLLVSISALLIFYSTLRLGNDLEHAATAALRILVLAWPGSVLIAFIDVSRLADYLAQRMGVSDRFVAAFAAVLQRVTSLGRTWQQLERARRVRGFGPTRDPVTFIAYAGQMVFALLVSAMRGADQMSIAMDARGFASAQDRSWAQSAPWTRLDSYALVMAVGLASVPITMYTLQLLG